MFKVGGALYYFMAELGLYTARVAACWFIMTTCDARKLKYKILSPPLRTEIKNLIFTSQIFRTTYPSKYT